MFLLIWLLMEFLNYFDNVFTVYHIALLVGGTFAGIILGALPGLSPTMSVALLNSFYISYETRKWAYTYLAPCTQQLLLVAQLAQSLSTFLARLQTLLLHWMAIKWRRAAKPRMPYTTASLAPLLVVVFGVFILIFFTPPLSCTCH